MKKITTLITLLILVGCNSMQTNIEVDSVDTFNLDNYSDFSIKINESSISAETVSYTHLTLPTTPYV